MRRLSSGMEGLLELAAMPDTRDSGDRHRGNDRYPAHHRRDQRAARTIALANKETLVTAGHLIMPLAKEARRIHPAGGQ